MFAAEATHLGLLFVVEQVDAVDDGQTLVDLEFDEGMADGIANLASMASFALEDDAEAKDRRVAWLGFLGKRGSDGRYFERAWDPEHFDGIGATGFEFGLGRPEQSSDIPVIVTGGNDRETPAGATLGAG